MSLHENIRESIRSTKDHKLRSSLIVPTFATGASCPVGILTASESKQFTAKEVDNSLPVIVTGEAQLVGQAFCKLGNNCHFPLKVLFQLSQSLVPKMRVHECAKIEEVMEGAMGASAALVCKIRGVCLYAGHSFRIKCSKNVRLPGGATFLSTCVGTVPPIRMQFLIEGLSFCLIEGILGSVFGLLLGNIFSVALLDGRWVVLLNVTLLGVVMSIIVVAAVAGSGYLPANWPTNWVTKAAKVVKVAKVELLDLLRYV